MLTLEKCLGQSKVLPQLREITDKEWSNKINKILDEQRQAQEERVNKHISVKEDQKPIKKH